MIAVLVAIFGVAVLAGISFVANQRFNSHSHLPMQWGFDGRVNWSAPRILALSFTPILASIILFGIAFVIILPAGRPEQGEEIILFVVSLGFVAVHLFHLFLMRANL